MATGSREHRSRPPDRIEPGRGAAAAGPAVRAGPHRLRRDWFHPNALGLGSRPRYGCELDGTRGASEGALKDAYRSTKQE